MSDSPKVDKGKGKMPPIRHEISDATLREAFKDANRSLNVYQRKVDDLKCANEALHRERDEIKEWSSMLEIKTTSLHGAHLDAQQRLINAHTSSTEKIRILMRYAERLIEVIVEARKRREIVMQLEQDPKWNDAVRKYEDFIRVHGVTIASLYPSQRRQRPAEPALRHYGSDPGLKSTRRVEVDSLDEALSSVKL